MKILGIDTSSKILSIALAEDMDVIEEKNLAVERKHSALLVPEIVNILKGRALSIDDVDAFVVGTGPGSFTGLRIGISTVKGFGIATKKPCIGMASIDAMALNVTALFKAKPCTLPVQGLALNSSNRAKIVPIIDAKRQNVYSAIYKQKGEQIIRVSDYLLLPIDKLMKKIKGGAVFLGDAIALYRERIERVNKKAVFLDEAFWYPKASDLIRLALMSGRIKKYKHTDLSKLNPIYLYPKDCQVRKA